MNCEVYNFDQCVQSNDCFLCDTGVTRKCISKFSDEKQNCIKSNEFTMEYDSSVEDTQELKFNLLKLIQTFLDYKELNHDEVYTLSIVLVIIGCILFLLS